MEYKAELHNLLKQLKQLEDSNKIDAVQYETRVKSALHLVKAILAMDGDCHELNLQTNIETIGECSVVYRGGAERQQNLEFPDVASHLKSENRSDQHVLHDLLQLVSDPENQLRIKPEYHMIAKRLSGILRQAIEMRDDAEWKLRNYVCLCLSYDVNYYKNNVDQDKLEDTQVLADIIESQNFEDNEDSIFSITQSVDIHHPLELDSNSPSFLAIYRLCLPILVGRPSMSIWKVSWAIVEAFKKQQHVNYFENGDEIDISPLLPGTHNNLNQRYMQEFNGERNAKELAQADPRSVIPRLTQIVKDLEPLTKEVDPCFPHLFKHYIQFVDQNICSATREDHKLLEEMPNLVNSIFSTDDVGVEFGNLIRRFIYLQSLLLCENPSEQVTLLMRGSCFEFERLLRLEEGTFRLWRVKLEKVQVINRRYSELDKRLQIISKWRSAIKKSELRDQLATSQYKEKLQLQMISRLRNKLRRAEAFRAISGQFSLTRGFNKWLDIFMLHKGQELDSERTYTNNLRRKCMNAWRDNTSRNNQIEFELEEKCDDFVRTSTQSLLKRSFSNWYKLLNASCGTGQLLSSLQHFNSIRNNFAVEIFFRKWRQSATIVFKLKDFKHKQNRRMVCIVLNNWRCQLHLDDWAHRIMYDHNAAKKRTVFEKWKLSSTTEIEARSFQNRNLVQRYFKRWVMESNANMLSATLELHMLKNTFKKWRLQSLVKRCEDLVNKEFVVSVFQHWKDRFDTAVKRNAEAVAFQNYYLTKVVLKQWRIAKYTLIEKVIQAERVHLKRFLAKWESRFEKQQSEFQNVELIDKHTLKHTLAIWKDKFDSALEDKLVARIPKFTAYSNALIKRRYFFDWRAQHWYQQELQSIEFSYTPGLRTFFLHWFKRVDEVHALEERVAIYDEGLMFRMLVQWRDRFEQIDAINEQGEDQLAQKNFALLRQSTQDWIFKFSKGVKRHHQLLETFQERADKRLARNVIHLWLQKHNLRLEEEELANETYVSNSSPLASRAHQQRQLKGDSSAPTPERRFSPIRISTPRSKEPSPSKMQATSQRMRDQQVSQLRERFGRAKLSPRYKVKPISPVKLNYNVDLSPPKDEKSPHGNEFLSPNTSSSTSPIEGQSQLNSFNDTSIISTAKRMGRIKPISFPTGEENDVRLSPASKVKREPRILT
ncbi:SFI1 [Candida theae]|uniref:SFI1 n=1 Tax=Candida theae TaxID=1198502 RepID=A0AAD5BI72_9ASCO|nr:SFI1 [Candida theae]KAI5965012.1 SFI1 [Candida theae]